MMTLADIIFIVAGGICIFTAYMVKYKALYVLFQTFGNVVLIINYLYLSSLSSTFVVIVATIRFITFYYLIKKYNDISWFMIIFFSVLAGILGMITVKQPIDYIFVVSVMIYTLCYKVKRLILMKILLLLPLSMMLTYSVLAGAYSGIISHGFEILLILLQTIIYVKNKKVRQFERKIDN